MEEIWKPIDFVHSDYQVSNLGRIKSSKKFKVVENKKDYFLKGKISNKGYHIVLLRNKNGNKIYLPVHRLVAIYFLDNPENKKEVNHKNGIKTDNTVENLEWCTSSENQRHAYNLGLQKPSIGENHGSSKLVASKVIEIRKKYSLGGVKQRELAEEYGVSQGQIFKIVNNLNWKHI